MLLHTTSDDQLCRDILCKNVNVWGDGYIFLLLMLLCFVPHYRSIIPGLVQMLY